MPGTVQPFRTETSGVEHSTSSRATLPAATPPPGTPNRRVWAIGLSLVVLVAGSVFAYRLVHGKQVPRLSVHQQTMASAGDGSLLPPPGNASQSNPAETPTDQHVPPATTGETMALFVDTPPEVSSLQSNYTGAKFEPIYGCYLGAYLDSALNLDGMKGTHGQALSREEAFGQLIGKPLTSSFIYQEYGQPFPMDFAKKCATLGISLHIAMEPNSGLEMVKDDAYLRQYARDAASSGVPIFLRFASEMNGNWVIYHKDPRQYVAKFRLVHEVMARYAANVAMLWCVFTDPRGNIPDYYPGDAYVDWVGVNIYNVYYHNNTRNTPGWREHPVDLLDYVYHRYAARKPIAIAEYGATHYDTVDHTSRAEFAASKLAQLLVALPALYPRVKLLDFFECNNVKYARADRRLNDYSVTDDPAVLQATRYGVASDYYLTRVISVGQHTLPAVTMRVTDGMELQGSVHLTGWLKSNVFRPTVIFSLDGNSISSTATPGHYQTTLDTGKYPPGPHTLRIAAYDSTGGDQLVGHLDVRVSFRAR